MSTIPPNPRTRGLTKEKVEERAKRTKATLGRIEDRKSLQVARAGKVNQRNNNCPSLEAYGSYAMTLIGYYLENKSLNVLAAQLKGNSTPST